MRSSDPSRPRRAWRRSLSAAAAAAAMLAVLGFYHWTVKTAQGSFDLHGPRNDYYNLLLHGFRAGHLYMEAVPDPKLLALPPDQRPGNAPFLLDASLYQGHYYLYFGVVPVVTLNWPCAVLTGHDMPEGLAAMFYATVAFGFSVWWWRDVRRRFFPDGGVLWDVTVILALGFCTVVPSTLRRPMFYEVAILAGWAFGMIGLWALTRAWLQPPRRKGWLLLAGVAMGLAIGSRPNLAPAALLTLGVGCGLVAWQHHDPAVRLARRLVVLLVWAGAGGGVIGLGLAGYNLARFGSVVEFGHTYQIGLKPVHLFHADNFWHNLRLYYLAAPQVGAYFPFVTPAEEPPKPADYVGREQAHGEWLWSVLVLFALLGLFRAWGRDRGDLRQRLPLAAPLMVWFAVNLLVTCLTGVRANRYMVDFHPALVLVTLFALRVAWPAGGWPDRLARGAAMLGIMLACLFNVLASMQVHDWFSKTAPADFQRVAAQADGAVWRLAPWIFSGVGDRELEIHWPGPGADGPSPLVSAGPGGFDDGIWIETDGARARFIYQHWDYGATNGPWFAINPSRPARVRISGAFLLPPPAHPWYGARPGFERAALKRRLRISVDGRTDFDRDVPSHNPAPWQQRWGEWQLGGQGGVHRYPGPLGRPHPLPVDDAWLAGFDEQSGVVRLRLKLPAGHLGLVEPLVQSGVYPACDLLMVRLTRPGFVQLIHDRFGAGAYTAEEFAVDYGQWQTVEVGLPAASDGIAWNDQDVSVPEPAGQLWVRWNGRVALVSPLGMHATRAQDLVVGANLVVASTSRLLFAEEIQVAPFLAPLPPVRSGVLAYGLDADRTLVGTRGVLIRWQRPGRPAAGIVWRRATPEAPAWLGWLDEGRITWAAGPLAAGPAPLRIFLPRTSSSGSALGAPYSARGLLEVDQGGQRVLSALTYYFAEGAAPGWAFDGRNWTGLDHAGEAEPPAGKNELPGRIVIRFALPEGGLSGSDPLLSAGMMGAADGFYLRSAGNGRYVLGLDHWGYGTVESAPVALAPGTVQTLTIELGSLFPPGQVAADLVRLRLNGTVVLDTHYALHPVTAGQVVVGRNPLGLSTAGPVFRGAIYSVRTNQPADK